MRFYAHSRKDAPTDQWQLLDTHLSNVKKMASEFAEAFKATRWATLTGHCHDLGKATNEWQAWLRHVNNVSDEFSIYYQGHPHHAFHGAQWLFKHSKEAGKLLSYCVAGHHAGLPDWHSLGEAGLKKKLDMSLPEPEAGFYPEPVFPEKLPFVPEQHRIGFQLQFFTRMLFSCLVDADFLDTERALNPKNARLRKDFPDIGTLYNIFHQNFKELRQKADPSIEVNKKREQVLHDCLKAAALGPGLFSLTVPTGGGKTLASMAFALEHARFHGLRRVIYVIPFTSIIEQNAEVFRLMLGDDAVIEHHCNFIPDDTDWKTRLAAENWDAPVVVTTNVQFFDSLYACKPSRCRKLHNIADSVVIFDEVQAIPVEKLGPCLEVIREFSKNYGVSCVLCTATQPAIKASDSFSQGLQDVREIIKDVPALFEGLKRTEEVFIGELCINDIADRLMEHEQVLCIVNTRKQALDLFSALPDSVHNYHLSALMYPEHRSRKLDEIRIRLANGKKCRVISTQLIEAGVDVDFPCVFRQSAGIDSIAQAAGRCNRNGRDAVPSKVFIFDIEGQVPVSFMRLAVQSASKLFERYSGNLTDPECVRQYFQDYFWKNQSRLDADGILDLCRQSQALEIQFREISLFRMIHTATVPIIVALEDKCIELVEQLRFVEHAGGILRKLQGYTVQIYQYQLDEIEGWLETPVPEIRILRSDEIYSDHTGLKCSSPEGEAFFI